MTYASLMLIILLPFTLHGAAGEQNSGSDCGAAVNPKGSYCCASVSFCVKRGDIKSHNVEYLLPDTVFNAVRAFIQVSTESLLCAGTGDMAVSKVLHPSGSWSP